MGKEQQLPPKKIVVTRDTGGRSYPYPSLRLAGSGLTTPASNKVAVIRRESFYYDDVGLGLVPRP